MGATFELKDIPEDMTAACHEAREHMIEAAAEGDDELMEKYLDAGELSPEDIRKGLRLRTLRNEIVPVLCGSAFKNKGVQAMLDAVVHYLPSPLEVPRSKDTWMTARRLCASRTTRHRSRRWPLRLPRIRSSAR